MLVENKKIKKEDERGAEFLLSAAAIYWRRHTKDQVVDQIQKISSYHSMKVGIA